MYSYGNLIFLNFYVFWFAGSKKKHIEMQNRVCLCCNLMRGF